MDTAVVVALIGGAATIIGAILGFLGVLVNKNRKENARDHSMVMQKLDTIQDDIAELDDDVKDIGGKLDSHLDDHYYGEATMMPRMKKTRRNS